MIENRQDGHGHTERSLLDAGAFPLRHPLVTPDRLKKLALVYRRQSTPEQVERNWGSALVQLDFVAMARAYGWPESLIRVIDDLGISGKTDDRSGWKEMTKLITQGVASAVFTWRVHRMSRELLFFEQLRIAAYVHDVVLFVDGRPLDPNDPSDTLKAQIEAVFAQFENNDRTERLRRARYAKAKAGHIVSQLPMGWIERPDGTFDFDPQAAPAIRLAHNTFRQTKSLRATAAELRRAGAKAPVRRGTRTVWVEFTVDRVRRFVIHPSYSGHYVFGRTVLGFLPDGTRVRRPLPEEEWAVKIPGCLPPYISPQEQKEFIAILKAHRFPEKGRPGNGPALCQGLVECARCNVGLAVVYRPDRSSHYYWCSFRSVKFGERHCFSVQGREIDAAVERHFLSVLNEPPLEIAAAALKEHRREEEERLAAVQAERERLLHQERQARERFENCDPRYRLVFVDAQRELEKAIEARMKFEERLALSPAQPRVDCSEEELRELCALASDVPRIWHHPRVSDRERKELLRCLIRKITVDANPEKIWVAIRWLSGETTSFHLWRKAGLYHLVEELWAQGLSVPEIQEKLRQGETSTLQSWDASKSGIYTILRRLGLRLHSRPSSHRAAVDLACRLRKEGMGPEEIAGELNSRGLKTLSGKNWTPRTVYYAIWSLARRAGHTC